MLQEHLTSTENELAAQRRLNHDLKEKREILEIEMAQKVTIVHVRTCIHLYMYMYRWRIFKAKRNY